MSVLEPSSAEPTTLPREPRIGAPDSGVVVERGADVLGRRLMGGPLQAAVAGKELVGFPLGLVLQIAEEFLVLVALEMTVEIEPVERKVAAEAAELLMKRAEEFGINLSLKTADGLEPVAMDVSAIHQCLVNLVSNAIDACRPEICGHEQGRVTLSTCTHPDWAVCFEVRDNGCGISDKDKEKIFTTFFSTKGADGTGLGLLNVQKIAQEHGGCIEVESVPTKGSAFRLLLPSGSNEERKQRNEFDRREDESGESHSIGI